MRTLPSLESSLEQVEPEDPYKRLLITGMPAWLLYKGLLSIWPSSRAKQHDWAWHRLLYIRDELVKGHEARARDGALMLQSLLATDTSTDGRRLKTLTLEVLRDAGEIGYAVHVFREWRRLRDPLRQALALITLANLNRTRGNYKEAMEYLKGAEDFLIGYRSQNDPIRIISLNQIRQWRLRIIAIHWHVPGAEEAETVYDEMNGLARESRSAITQIETWREEAGYHMLRFESQTALPWRRDDLEKAAVAIEKAWEKVNEPSFIESPRTALPVMGAKIELLFMAGQRKQALELVPQYLDLCHKYPILHCIKRLKTLAERYGFNYFNLWGSDSPKLASLA